VKTESGRLALAGLNVVLAAALGLLCWRTFFVRHQPGTGEVVDRVKPGEFAIAVQLRKNTADQYAPGWIIDRPKPPPAPPPAPPPGPAKPEDLNNIFQVVAVAVDPNEPKKSSIVLRKKSPSGGGGPPGGQAIDDQMQLGIGDKLETYELKSIAENPDGSVDITILNGATPCKVKFSPEK
jgi:hypothetical protein